MNEISGYLEIGFWSCLAGERMVGTVCEPCEYGTFSLIENAELCKACD